MPPDGRTERREVSHGEESQPHQWRDDTTTTTSPHVQLTHLLYTPSPFITLKI
jgi:hypothetical protein